MAGTLGVILYIFMILFLDLVHSAQGYFGELGSYYYQLTSISFPMMTYNPEVNKLE